MPFQVYLMPTTASPPPAVFSGEVSKVVTAGGGVIDADGSTVRIGDHAEFSLTKDGKGFLIKRISPSFCRIVFTAARQTNSTVNRGGSDVTPLTMRGSAGKPLYDDDIKTDFVASPRALCVRLNQDLRDWNRFIRRAQAEGVMGPDEEILQPPPDPGAEVLVTADPSGVAARCQKAMDRTYGGAGQKIARTVVSRNPKWGVVWRGDVVDAEFPDAPFRTMCWKAPKPAGSGRISISTRPLEMFDEGQSIAPLEADRRPK